MLSYFSLNFFVRKLIEIDKIWLVLLSVLRRTELDAVMFRLSCGILWHSMPGNLH